MTGSIGCANVVSDLCAATSGAGEPQETVLEAGGGTDAVVARLGVAEAETQ